MALKKQVISSVFSTGIDSSADPKLTSQGLLQLTDGRFDYRGAIEKREGLTTLSGSYTDAQMAQYKGRPVIVGDNIAVFDGATATSGSFDTVTTVSGMDAEIKLRSADGLYSTTGRDCVLIASDAIMCIVQRKVQLEDDSVVWAISAYDTVKDTLISTADITGYTNIKMLKAGTLGYALARKDSDGKLYYNTLPADGDLSSLSWTEIDSGIATTVSDVPFDACIMDDAEDYMGIVHKRSSDGDAEFAAWEIGYSAATTTMSDETYDINCIAVGKLRDEVAVVAYSLYDSGTPETTLKAEGFNASATSVISVDTLATRTKNVPFVYDERIVELIMHPTSSTVMNVYYTFYNYDGDTAAFGSRRVIESSTYEDDSGTGDGTAVGFFHTGAMFASKPFVDANGDYYFCLFYERPMVAGGGSNIDDHAAFTIVNEDGHLIARALIQYAYIEEMTDENDTVYGIREAYHAGSDEWYIACGRQVSVDSVGVATVKLTNTLPDRHCIEAEDYLYIPGTLPLYYDGEVVHEHGFLGSPDLIDVVALTSTGSLSEAKYGYVACYEWLDRHGRRNRSAPSAVASTTLSGGEDTVTVTVRAFSLTNRYTANRIATNISVVIYRTLANGDTYHRVKTLEVPLAFGSSFNDTAADTDIDDNEYIYTYGGVLQHRAPPPYWVSCIHQNRLAVVNNENKNQEIWYSNRFTSTSYASFSPFLQIKCSDAGGEIKALASFTDRLIIFKQDKIYATHGEGLSTSGTGQDYAVPYLISEGVGCINQKTIVQIPDGMLFESSDGIWLLNKTLQVSPIGDPIKHHLSEVTLVKADIVPDKHYAIFLSSGAALVYDYRYGIWSTFSNHEASDGVVVANRLYVRDTSTSVFVQKAGIYRDSSSVYPLTIRTGWFPFADLGGFMRLYGILLLGQNVSIHKLRVKVAYDFDPVWVDNQTFDSSDIANYLDATSHYGSGQAAGYRDKSYLLDVATSQQKCTSVMLEITDETTGGDDPDQAYTMSGISFLVGIKRYQKRMDPTRKAG